MRRMSRFLLSLLALASFACVTTPAVVPEAPSSSWVEPVDAPDEVRLTIVGTNDLHGWLEPKPRPTTASGEPMLGGVDMFGGYMDVLRRTRPDRVVLVDAGDMFQGTLVVNLTEGAAVIKAYNHLDYDAVAIGNHEFDYGPVGEPVVALTEGEDPLGNVKKRISEANFPVLVGNIFEKETGRPVRWDNAKRMHLVERSGVTIGVIGLATPMTPSVTLRQNVESLDFKPLAPAAIELSNILRRRGADVVLLVMHAGGGCDDHSDPTDVSTCQPGSELWDLMHELPAGTVDAVVAGHTHQYLAHFVNGVPSIQSSSFGVAFGAIDLVYNRTTKKLDPSKTKIWQPVSVCRVVSADTGDCKADAKGQVVAPEFMGRRVTPDEKLAELIRPDLKMVEAQKEELLGPVLERPFGRSRTEESELGNLVADIMRERVAGAHVAFTNSGGIRADLHPGPLTYGDVFNALPFENRIAQLDVTGRELVELMRLGVAGKHGIMQVSGLHMTVAAPGTTACDGSRLVSVTFADGSPIDPEARYVVLTNDFVAGGGDGYSELMEAIGSDRINVRNDLPPLREVVAAHLRASVELKGPPPPGPARISFDTVTCDAP